MKPWLVLIWPTRLCAGNVAQDALSFAAGVSPSQDPSCRRPTERYLTSYGAPSVPSFRKHYQHQHQINIESSSTSTSLHIPSSNTPNIILPLPPTTLSHLIQNGQPRNTPPTDNPAQHLRLAHRPKPRPATTTTTRTRTPPKRRRTLDPPRQPRNRSRHLQFLHRRRFRRARRPRRIHSQGANARVPRHGRRQRRGRRDWYVGSCRRLTYWHLVLLSLLLMSRDDGMMTYDICGTPRDEAQKQTLTCCIADRAGESSYQSLRQDECAVGYGGCGRGDSGCAEE